MAGKRSERARKRLIIAAVTTVVVVVGVGSFWAVRKSQLKSQRIALRAQGLEDARAGNNERAADDLWAYLQIDPDDKEVLEKFAVARLASPKPKGQHVIDSIRAYRRLKLLSPGRQDINIKLCDLYYRISAFTELNDLADQTLQINPNELAGLRAKTLALEALGRRGEANKAAEQWFKVAPDDTTAMLMVIQTLVGEGQNAERAVQRAEELAKARPDDLRVRLVRGMVLLKNKRIPEAIEIFRALAPKVTGDEDLAIRLSGQFDLLAKGEESRNLLLAAYEATKSPRIRLLLARRALEGGKFEEAVKFAESVAPASQQEAAAITAVANSLSNKETTPVTLSDPGWTAIAAALLNRAATSEADARKAIEDIQSIIAAEDIGPYPSYALGINTAILGETDRAIGYLVRAAETELSWGIPFRVAAELALRAGSYQKARVFADHSVFRQPLDLGAHLLWTRAVYAEAQSDPAFNTDELLDRAQVIQKAVPGETTTLLICLDLLCRRSKLEEAKALITESVLKRDTASEEAVLGAALTSQTYKLGLERDCLALGEKRFGKTPQWRYMTAASIAQAGKPEEGLAIIEEGMASANPQDKARLAEMAARYAESARLPNAASLWKAAVDANPTSAGLLRTATAADSVNKDSQLLESFIERLKSAEGAKGNGWRLAQAKYLLRTGTERTTSDAAVLLGEILSSGTPSAEVHALLAQAMQKLGNHANAIAQLNAAVRLDPGNARIRLLLAALLQMSRDTEGAKKQADAAIASDNSPAIRGAAAEIFASQGDVGKAISLIEAVPDSSRSRVQTAMLGELYERSGQTDKAAGVARELLAEGADARAIMLKARIASADGKSADADKTLAELDALNLPPLQRKMLLAQYYTQVSKFPEAMRLIDEVIAESPKTLQAYRHKVVLQLNTRDTAGAIATAEAAIAAGGTDNALKTLVKQRANVEALMSRNLLPLVLEMITRPEDSKVMHTVKAVSDPDPINVANAVNAINAAASDSTGEYALQQALIQTLAYLGRMNEASPLAANLARALPFSQEAAVLWAEVEVVRGNDASLLDALNWLEGRFVATPMPENFALLHSRVLRKDGQFEPALARATRNIQPGATGNNRVAWLVEYGLTVYAKGKKAEFDKQYDAWAASEKALPEAWGIAASREIAPVDTLRWLQAIKKSVGPTIDLAFAADLAAKRSSNADLNTWAETAIADLYAKSAMLAATDRIDIAVFQESRGDLVNAEATYRSLLNDSTYSLAAKNNLAVLLSRKGAHDEAIALAESVVIAAPRNFDYLDTLATVQEKAGKTKEALANLEKVMRVAPGSLIFRIHYAHALHSNGKIAEAMAQLAEIKIQSADRPMRPVIKVEFDELEKLLAPAAK